MDRHAAPLLFLVWAATIVVAAVYAAHQLNAFR